MSDSIETIEIDTFSIQYSVRENESLNNTKTNLVISDLSEQCDFHSHITDKNLEAIELIQKSIITVCDKIGNSDNNVNLKCIENAIQEQKNVLQSITDIYRKLKEKKKETSVAKANVQALKKEIKELHQEYETLNSSENNKQNDIRTFKRAIEYYTKCFNMKVHAENSDNDIYKLHVNFNPKCNKYIGTFVFDSKNKEILSFDVSKFVSEENQAILQQLFSDSKNILALMSTLKKIVERNKNI